MGPYSLPTLTKAAEGCFCLAPGFGSIDGQGAPFHFVVIALAHVFQDVRILCTQQR